MGTADPRELVGAFRYRLNSWPSRYGFAILAVLFAAMARYFLSGVLGHNLPFVLFYPAIACTTWVAGLWPGIFAVLVSAGLGVYLFVSGVSYAAGLPQTGTAVFIFLIAGFAISAVVDLSRRRSARLREFQQAVEGVEEMIAVVDRNYRYVIANRAFLEYQGMTREQVLGHTVAEVLNQGVFENMIKQKVDECFAGKLVQHELRYRYPTLGERDVLVSYFPVEGLGGIDRVTVIIQDVTERRQAERSLKLFRTLIDQSNDAVEVVDPDTLRFLDINERACKDLGYTREEMLSLTVFDINPNVDESMKAGVLAQLQSAGFLVQESVHRRKDGSVFPVEISLRYVRLERPYVVAVSRDTTARKHAEGALRDSEDRYRDLVQHSQDLVCTHDLSGRLLSVNPAPARLLGYSPEELLMQPMRNLIAPEFRDQFDSYLERIGRLGADHGIMAVLSRGGERRIWEYNNTLRTEGVASPVVRGMARDITDRKRAEAALRNSEKRLRLLFEKNVAAVAISSPDGMLIDCNDAWAHMLGYAEAGDLRACATHGVYFDGAEQAALLQELRQKNALIGRELQLRRKDGTSVWALVNAVLLTIDSESALIQTTAVDITEKRKAEQALKHSEERFRVALKDSPITVFSQDQDLRYTWIYNPRLCWQKEIVGSTDEDVIGSERARALVELKRRAMETGKSVRAELLIPYKDKNHGCDITIEPLFDSANQAVGITGAAVVIGRLRELADNLQVAKDRLAQEKLYLQGEIESELGFEEIIGQDSSLKEVLRSAKVVAPTDSTVLLLGETGTGKELVARAIHLLSARREKNFIKLNCAAVPSGLLESELFGHERGAFTSAVGQKVGRMELADKGTLFLDEVGELPLELQPKLLRALQDREFERLGGVHTIRVDVRIISATNRDLKKDVADKRFREDLFYRLNVFPIELPTLRERRSDIPMLVWHFVRKHAARMGQHVDMIPASTMEILQSWNWPGNIRELENMVERMVILTKGSVLAPPPVELILLEDPSDNLTEIEREHIIRVLRETNGVLAGEDGAASRLGVKRTTLQSMLKRFNIDPREYRRSAGIYEAE